MTITTTPDGLGGTFVYASPVRVGHVFPKQTSGWPNPQPIPGCAWFGKRHGWQYKAEQFDTKAEAFAHVTQETP